MTDQVAKIENDLEQARAQLQQTLEQVNRKVGSELIRLEKVLRVNPILSICLAGAVGFAAGLARDRNRMFGAFAIGVLTGFSIKRSLSREDSRRD